MNGNILKIYLIKCSKWFMLVMPILVLFFHEHGFSMQETFILKAIYSVAIVIFEIPSGYWGDTWGRRNSLILGTSLGTLGFLIYSLTSSFYMFGLAEFMLGLGASFISGSDSAILYDTLQERGDEADYTKYEGRVTSIGNFAEAFAAILGGVLAVYSTRYPFYGQTLIAAVGVVAAILLVEPKRAVIRTRSFKDILNIVHDSFVVNKKLCFYIVFCSLIGASTLTTAWYMQPYFIEIELPVVMFGAVWTVLNFIAGGVTLLSWRVEKALSTKAITLYIVLAISTLLMLMSQFTAIYMLAVAALFYMVRGVATPVLKNYINVLTTSDVRATVLSLRSFVIRVIFAVIAPVMGWITDNYSLSTALLMFSIFTFISTATVLAIGWRKRYI